MICDKLGFTGMMEGLKSTNITSHCAITWFKEKFDQGIGFMSVALLIVCSLTKNNMEWPV